MQKQITVTIGKKDYSLTYPNVGKKLKIENAKLALTSGLYGQLAISNHDSACEMLDIVDAFSFFMFTCP